MKKHVPTEQLQEALTVDEFSTISMSNPTDTILQEVEKAVKKACC